jgi:hypothetical protein
MRPFLQLFLLLLLIFIAGNTKSQPLLADIKPDISRSKFYTDSRPWTRWWWFAADIQKKDLTDNLIWLKNHGFGGVEIAWVYPLNRMNKDTIHYTPRQKWLSPAWSQMVRYAKNCADSLGLGCDFTFGSLWPFGDTEVPFGEATMNMTDPNWRQEIAASWDYPKKGYVIDHLNKTAFANYAKRTGDALKPALQGAPSGLFCDSWEVETKYLSTNGFTEKFAEKYGYSILPYLDSLYSKQNSYAAVRYDYMKLLSEHVIDGFYIPFTQKSHELGAYSRAQCSGAPCDILSAYASIDIPESEALLYEPTFSNIVASAAALSGKRVVTSETFTCLYGWPRDHHSEEQTADLKLLADALFANGVNHIIWHGKPLNPAGVDTVKFYASVHVGDSGSLANEIAALNKYMARVSAELKKGLPVSAVAVYLPTEDSWIAGELPPEKQMIWAWGEYEQRYTYFPIELTAWRPSWINGEFLQKATFREGMLKVGDFSFSALYLDVNFMEQSALKRIVELAESGLPVCLKRIPAEPGLHTTPAEYSNLLKKLTALKNVQHDWKEMDNIPPLVTGTEKIDFWGRQTTEGLTLFFANPRSKGLTFPLTYGQSLNTVTDTLNVQIYFQGKIIPYTLVFKPYQSILLKIGKDARTSEMNISFLPKTPVYSPRISVAREKWEIELPKK